jgi:hypothetical protein
MRNFADYAAAGATFASLAAIHLRKFIKPRRARKKEPRRMA